MTERLLFFGSPDPARRVLDVLVGRGRAPLAVVTQPDRPAGRGRKLRSCPVAERARQLGLELLQPTSVKTDEFRLWLRSQQAALAIVVAYGRILPGDVLEIPAGGFLNVHFSLLPRHRGASPVTAAILAGDPVTGVSIMRLDPGLDTGPVLARREVDLDGRERAGELTATLADLGAEQLLEVLDQIDRGAAPVDEEQSEEDATLCRPIRKDEGRIDWRLPASELDRRLRAFDPWPGVFAFLGDERIRILEAAQRPAAGGEPGSVVTVEDGQLVVSTGDGGWCLEKVQPAGKRPMTGADLARGRRLAPGTRFE